MRLGGRCIEGVIGGERRLEAEERETCLRGPSLKESDGEVEPFLARFKVWHWAL